MKSIILFVSLASLCVCAVAYTESNPIYGESDDYDPVESSFFIELFTLKNPDKNQILDHENISSVDETNFNRSAPTRIFIHGWQSSGEFKDALRQAFFHDGKHDINLIGINWEYASASINYFDARQNVGRVGIFTANYINALIEYGALNLSKLSLIGFSLGAHVAGIAGKNVKSGKIPKITGLDPAGPRFHVDRPNERLSVTDALYVETIHTSKLGYARPMGDVSFFPNGKRWQPGCGMDLTGSCSHQRAYLYFCLSINKRITGYMCDSERCSRDVVAVLGGEPGGFNQAKGVFFTAIDLHD